MGTGERLPDLTDVAAAGTRVQVVEPGSPEDTLSHQASPPAQAAPSAPAGAPADQGGEGKGDVINPAELTPARPVLAPPPPPGAQPAAQAPAQAPAAPAAPVAPAEGQPEPAPAAPEPAQPAPAAVPAGVAPPATQAPEPVALAPAAPEAPAQPTAEEIRVEAAAEANAKVATVQSSMDKRMNGMQATQDELVASLNTQKLANRDLVLNGVPEEQKALKLKEWELEDQITENEKLRKETLSYGTDVELASLLIDFRDVPEVTEETLAAVPIDERDIWCMTKRNEHLQEQLTSAQNGQTTAAPAGQAPVPQPAAAVPAGAQAPSDVGGAGTPPPPGQPTHNPAQNREAMTENMKSGWEQITFGR